MLRPVHRLGAILSDNSEEIQDIPSGMEDDHQPQKRITYDDVEAGGSLKHSRNRSSPTGRPEPLTWLCAMMGLCVSTLLYNRFWIRSSVPSFVGIAVFIIAWVTTSWARIIRQRKSRGNVVYYHPSRRHGAILYVATALVTWWAVISVFPERKAITPVLKGNGDKYFIAVNLHNNEAILPDFTRELTSLIQHIGVDDVFISIYESNSQDRTEALLTDFRTSLNGMGVQNRIVAISNAPGRAWPYSTSPERIEYLTNARNIAMEPIQSPDPDIRAPNWHRYSKVIFLNDIRFDWRDIARLIATRAEGLEDEDYDLACALDFGRTEFYDVWVAKDICGTPFHSQWPFVVDGLSQRAVRDLKPFPVTSCWNGAVVFNSRPFLYGSDMTFETNSHTVSKRGWKMIDNATDYFSRSSPPLQTPLKFRASNIESCDHSEAFLFSYDLHRLYANTQGRPRILINPAVQVAYNNKWFYWNNTFLRWPIIRLWRSIWSHRISFWLFNRPFERFLRVRDYCTWAALKIPIDRDRCPSLPGPTFRHWWQLLACKDGFWTRTIFDWASGLGSEF